MQEVIGALSGYRGVRAGLLVALKKAQPITAHVLGEQFGLTTNGLRRYLKGLEEEGLVKYERAVHGVGAPVFAYSLTATGEALFPRSYVTMLASALGALRADQGTQAVERVVESEWNRVAEEVQPILEALPFAERVALVAELLTAKGYMAEAMEPDERHLAADQRAVTVMRIHNCASGEIAKQFPEVCAAEAKFIERLFGVPLVQTAHRRDGCGRCEYGVLSHHLVEKQEQA